MADAVVIRTNIPDFKAQMRALGQDFERKVFRAGVAAGTQVFRKEVERRAPRKTGLLARAVYIKRSRDSGRGKEHYFVGIRQGKAARNRTITKGYTGNLDAYYWRFVEEGHLVRQPGGALRGGTRTRTVRRNRIIAGGGRMVPGAHFLKRSFDAKKDEALKAVIDRIEKRIAKENAKR